MTLLKDNNKLIGQSELPLPVAWWSANDTKNVSIVWVLHASSSTSISSGDTHFHVVAINYILPFCQIKIGTEIKTVKGVSLTTVFVDSAFISSYSSNQPIYLATVNWTDKIGGRIASQAIDDYRPMLFKGIYNNLDAIHFGKLGNVGDMTGLNFNEISLTNQIYTIILVQKQYNYNVLYVHIYLSNSEVYTSSLDCGFRDNTTTTMLYTYIDTGVQKSQTSNEISSALNILAIRSKYADRTRIFRNNIILSQNTTTDILNLKLSTIGYKSATYISTRMMYGDICEILIFNENLLTREFTYYNDMLNSLYKIY